MKQIKFLSVFSGIEAASVAWEPLGWKAVGFSEIEPFPCAVLKHRFPNTTNYGDITKYKDWPIEPGTVDLLAGGSPCQSYSVAGLRRGLADPRGNLTLVFLGVTDRFKPKWIVWENVPGVLSSNGGRDFGTFLGSLAELGYGFAYRVLDAVHFGVAQRRRRVFLVGCLGNWDAPAKVLFEPESLRWDTSTRRKKGKGFAPGIDESVDGNGLQKSVGTLCADTHPGAYSGQDAYTGRLIPQAKPIAIQGTIIGRSENAGPQGAGATEGGPMFTLTKTDIHAVAINTIMEASRRDGIRIYEGKSPTLQSFMGTGGNNVPMVNQPIHFDTYNQTVSNVSFTLSCSASDANHVGTVFTPTMAVRRLTPNECLRLQGFPDFHTQIPWKGKPAEQCPDGPQYKAAGNSWAVPVARWVGQRIQMFEEGVL